MLALRAVVGRRLAPFFALLLSMGGGLVAFHAAPAAAADCTATSPDTDLDRVPDCWETSNGLTVGRRDSGSDKDRDGLSATTEYTVDAAYSAGGPLVDVYNAADDDSDNDDEEYVAGVTTGATGGTPATGITAATGDPAASAAVPPSAAPQAKARHMALEFFYRSRTLRALNRAKYYLAREQHSFTHSGCINISDHF